MSRAERIAQRLGEYRVNHSVLNGSNIFAVTTCDYELNISESERHEDPWVHVWDPDGGSVLMLLSYRDEDTIRMLKGLIGDG